MLVAIPAPTAAAQFVRLARLLAPGATVIARFRFNRHKPDLERAGAHTVIEAMRQGKSPEQACLEALLRISDNNHLARLKRDDGRPNFDVKFYALNKKSQYGGAAIWSGAKFAVHDTKGNRHEPCAYLYKRNKR